MHTVQEDKQWNFQSSALLVVDYREFFLSSLRFSDYPSFYFFFKQMNIFYFRVRKNHKAIYTEDYKKKKA